MRWTKAGVSWTLLALGGLLALRMERGADSFGSRPGLPDAAAAEGWSGLFVANRGQWPAAVGFTARFPGMTVAVGTSGLHLDLVGPEVGAAPRSRACALCAAGQGGTGCGGETHAAAGRRSRTAVGLGFEGAHAAELEGEQPVATLFHFFQGDRPEHWRSAVPAWRSVRMRGLYAGIDLLLREERGRLEYDILLAPGARLDQVVVRCQGVTGIELLGDGSLSLRTPLGPLTQTAPRTWSVHADGRTTPVACRFRPIDAERFSFAVHGHDPELALVVDPGLIWGTFLGGITTEQTRGVGVDRATGHVTIAGSTLSPNFPATPGAFDPTYNGFVSQPYAVGDVFVAQLDGATGALRWATFLGGSGNDSCGAVGVDGSGAILVSGWTGSTDFPTTPGAFDQSFNGIGQGTIYGGGDLFVTRLAPSGAALHWSTYIGGDDLEYILSMVVQADGTVTVGGHVHSTNFPTTPGAFDRTFGGFSDSFVTRLHSSGSSLVFSTFFGGTQGEEYTYAMVVGADGSTTFGGATDSINLPVTPGALQPVMNGGQAHFADGFAARLDPTGAALQFCTYVGSANDDTVYGVCLEPTGEITLTGETNSPSFLTTPGAFSRTNRGLLDGFVLRLDPTGNGVLWCTLFGGVQNDRGEAILADGSGGVLLTGSTESPDFPVTAGAADTTHNGSGDPFVLRLDAAGARVSYATFHGGLYWDVAHGIAREDSGHILISGETWSPDCPTTPGAAQLVIAGGSDAFAARLDLLPRGAAHYGAGTAGCEGLPTIRADSMPRVGHAGFVVGGGFAPAIGVGVLAAGAQPRATPIPVLGAALWVDPSPLLLLFPAGASAMRGTEVALPIPADPSLAGGALFLQFLWPDRCATGGLSASNALALTIQP